MNMVLIPIYTHTPTGTRRAIPVPLPFIGSPKSEDDIEYHVEICKDAPFTEDCEYAHDWIEIDMDTAGDGVTFGLAEAPQGWVFRKETKDGTPCVYFQEEE